MQTLFDRASGALVWIPDSSAELERAEQRRASRVASRRAALAAEKAQLEGKIGWERHKIEALRDELGGEGRDWRCSELRLEIERRERWCDRAQVRCGEISTEAKR